MPSRQQPTWMAANPESIATVCAEHAPTVGMDSRLAGLWAAPGNDEVLPRHLRRQVLELAVLQIIIEPPALDLIHHLVELRARDCLVDEALAAAEAGKIPWMRGLEFRRYRELPQRQIFGEIDVHRLLGAVERAQIA